MGNPRFHDDERQLLAEINDKKPRFAQLPIEAQKKIHDLVAYGRKGLGLRQYKFLLDMKQALSEMHRVLKPNGKCVIVIGNNNFKVNDEEVEFRNAQYLYEMGPSVGFKQEDIIDRNLLKTSYGAIQKEHLLILRK
jgi:ubiquinone/menaquinone biosynthesis C-methylase UbiE